MQMSQGDGGAGGPGESPDPKGLSCRACGMVFTTFSAIERHMIEAHGHGQGQFMINTDNTSGGNSSKVKEKFLKRAIDDDDNNDDDKPPSKKPLTYSSASSLVNSLQSKSSDVNLEQPRQQQPSLRDILNPKDHYASVGHYECDLCNKVYLTGQALGGHKKNCNRRHQQTPAQAEAQASLIKDNSVPQPSSSDLSVQNICIFCTNIFPSIEALAIHVACCDKLVQQPVIQGDWVLPQPVQGAANSVLLPSSANSSVQGQATGDGQTNVDQNKIPPSRDRDDEDDDASSPVA